MSPLAAGLLELCFLALAVGFIWRFLGAAIAEPWRSLAIFLAAAAFIVIVFQMFGLFDPWHLRVVHER